MAPEGMTMDVRLDRVRANFAKERQFVQNCYLPRRAPKGGMFLYVKIHKAASTTILASLAAHLFRAAGKDLPDLAQEDVHKLPIKVFQRARYVGFDGLVDQFTDPSVFSFTLVRAPLRRIASAWADKIAAGDKQRSKLNRYLKRPDDTPLDFPDFVDVITSDSAALNLDRHWRPQWNEGAFDALQYDFIGDVGQLHQSLAVVTERLFGATTPHIVDTRESMGHRTSRDAVLAALPARGRKKLEAAFADDLALYERVRRDLDARFTA
ncbi:MAG: sulfotransferase family 2 domain-containing protein [Pseudomonadota bacterium]